MSVEEALRGVWHGWEVYDGLDDNRVATAGGDWPDVTFHQILLVYWTMGALNELVGGRIPLPARIAAATIPALLWKGHTAVEPNSLTKKGIYFLHEHIGHICFGVAALNGVALIHSGRRLMGSLALGLTLFAPAEHHIPHGARYRIRLAAQFLAIAAAVKYGDRFDQVMSLAKGALLAKMWLPEHPPSSLKEEMTIRDPKELKGLEIVPEHVHLARPPIPPPPDVELSGFLTLFDQLTWADHAKILNDAISEDDEWKKRPVDSRGTHQEFAREGVTAFINSLQRRGVAKGGDLRSFDQVTAGAKHVLKALQEKDPATQARWLVRLGVDAGHHCATAYTREVSAAYANVCNQPIEGLRDQIALVLGQQREVLFQQTLQARHEKLPSWVRLFFDPSKEHNYNQFVQLFGGHVGHPLKEQADGDLHAVGHVEQKIILSILDANIFPFFWRDYNEEAMINAALEGTRITKCDQKVIAPVIQYTQIEDWLRSAVWSGEGSFDEWKEEHAYDENFCLKREYVTLMLVHYGFLRPQTHS